MKTPYELFHIECGKGWEKLYQPVIDEAKRTGASVLQVKEKFGTLRLYLGGASEQLYKMRDEAEERSATTCEKCGDVGKLRGKGWLVTLCDKCDEERYKNG